MANILAAANGNWSSTATWIGGVVPTAADNAYANNRTITIDVNATVTKLSTQAENGATAGGSFTFACAVTPITVTATTIAAGTTTCLTITSSGLSGRSAIVYATDVYPSSTNTGGANGIQASPAVGETFYFYGGNLRGLTGFNTSAIQVNGNGTFVVNANCYASATTQSHGITITSSLSPTIQVTGNIYGGTSSGSGIYLSGNTTPTFTITGNVYGGTNASGVGLYLANNNSVTLVGNAYGGTTGTTAHAIRHDGTGVLNVVGTCEAGTSNSSAAVWMNAGGTTNLKRVKGNGYGVGSTGIAVAYAVLSTSQAAVINVEEFECGSRGMVPIQSNFRLTSVSTNVAVMALSSGTKTLVDGNAAGLMPAVTNVRSGVTYNAGNLTGTCAVPAASSVAAGVAVDNTVGTAVLTQANVWSYSLASASGTAGSVGEKLKKAATAADIIALG